MKKKYKNWIYFIAIPIVIIIVLEFYLELPYYKLNESYGYVRISLLADLIIFSLSSFGLLINYWHFKKLSKDFTVRQFQSIISVPIICILIVLTKFDAVSAFMPKKDFIQLYHNRIPAADKFDHETFVVSKKVEKILTGTFLLIQLFYATMILRSSWLKRSPTNFKS